MVLQGNWHLPCRHSASDRGWTSRAIIALLPAGTGKRPEQDKSSSRAGIHWIIFAMRHWWVNQNQTYKHELGGGYL